MATSRLKDLLLFVRQYQASFANGILVAATLGGEEIFRTTTFNCPCRQPAARLYGSSFIAGPAAVLFLIGILLSPITWRLLHGCCYRSDEARHGTRATAHFCLAMTGRSLVAPSAWVFVTLMDGSYYTCIMSSAPCQKDSEENNLLSSRSQLYSWVFLASVLLLTFLVLAFARCSDRFTYYQSHYVALYRDVEQRKMEETIKNNVEDNANAKIQALFGQSIQTKEDWDKISKLILYNVKNTGTPL